MDNLKADILSLSDDNFGSKYGRDRTSKEVAMKSAYDTAGYKSAEADYKREQDKAKKAGYPTAEAEEKALREKAVNELTEKKGTSLNKEAARATGEQPKAKSSGGGGGGVPLDKMDKMKKMNYKEGGKVSSASKRADGCAIKGKTRGRML